MIRNQMPLIRIDKVGESARMALWRMTESPQEMIAPKGVSLDGIHSEVRLREILTEYSMLRSLISRDDLIIKHLPSGKPLLTGYSLSLSHTKGWAAMLLSEKSINLGIDIEYYSDRVNKVADRFIRHDEQSGSLAHKLINWSAKETVYKALYSEDLHYFEMRVYPFCPSSQGNIKVEDLRTQKDIKVSYVLNNDYVLTWAVV